MAGKQFRIMSGVYILHTGLPDIAYGSTCELETQTLLSGDLNYLNEADQSSLLEKIKEVERMLMALIKSLENKNNS